MALAHSPKVVTSNLVLYLDAANPKSYSESGTIWSDISGTLNNGTLTNAPTFNTANSGYFSFNGTNQYCAISYTPTLTPTEQISTESFAYLADWNILTSMRILSKTQTGGYSITINDGAPISSGYMGILAYIGGSYRAARVALNTLSSGWHHFVGTFDGQYLRFYVDGNNVDTYNHASTSTISYSNNNVFVIGAEPGAGSSIAGGYFTGSISNVKVYNRALTAAEISQNFNANRGRFGI